MPEDPLFRGAGIGMVRAPVRPVREAAEVRPDTGPGPDETARLTETLRTLADDPSVREAVDVSSPSLAEVVHRVLDRSGGVPLPQLRRSVRALASYRLRMSGRATPFGLMAGVAPVHFTDADGAEARWGDAHTRAVRPDREWLTALAAAWERRPEILRRLRVVTNALCTVRGGRLVLPYVPESTREESAEGAEGGTVQEVSVRYTAVVRAVREIAHRPVRGAELAQGLLERFPGATDQAVNGVLSELVAKEILLTDARPPLEAVDPLGYLLRVCADIPAEDLPERAELTALQADIARYATRPLGEGRTELRNLTARMRRLNDLPRPLQVDLALDAGARLPTAVAEEAARAAALLWRLSPPQGDPAHLREYHEAFLGRYGTERLVPLVELLDPDTGLAAPAGYRRPVSPRRATPPEPDRERGRILAELAQQALLDGDDEVVLTDDHPAVHALTDDGGRPPASLELNVHLLAGSCEALADGDFRLVVAGGSGKAGAMLGRFGYLLGDKPHAELAGTARSGAAPDGALAAQVAFRTGRARAANVAQVPQWLDHTLPVGCFADPDDPAVLDLRRLAVGADRDRLHLVDTGTGRRVSPAVFHVLNPQWSLPNAARFVCEIADSGVRRWQPWDWGVAAALPYLPRVRYGRTVLAPARWRPTAVLRDADLPFPEWLAALEHWRKRWRVPDRIWAGRADRGVPLDLRLPGHPALLRHELLRHEEAEVREVPADAAGRPDGWLGGPDGARRTEITVPLHTTRTPDTAPAPQARTRPHTPRSTASGVHLPGGDWLYTAWYAPAERHDELLAVHLPPLLDQLPPEVDRWFFLRYGDAVGSHLRLRFHAPREALHGALLPRLHALTGTLRESGLVGRVVWDTYDPELERYGGPEALTAAERVFHADSVAVVEHLRRGYARTDTTEPLLRVAAGFADLARAFHGTDGEEAGEAAAEWLTRTVAKDETHQRAFRERRRAALPLVDPYRAEPGPAAVDEVLRTAWTRRAETVSAYGQLLRDLGDRSWSHPDQVLLSLLHMHHNRLAGVDRDAERLALAVARGAARAHSDRRRHGR
ncbi:lantibiotic dehydratase [Streptomyces catenulae]|uniref:Lantibiotic dehydratase n=1 Tax=Streptomyces catenulae TaxID=66875 RepID=A0ABV2YSB6_9ACTN|nr:lantibiotic dehydratase [Streptomyces catenulae]